ncbi:MAG TPA: DUF938 domain-containing protein [Gammaproteobacteria bacterium]|nr:DUF938 domain-containing protein [Gammaproteobacteria bacterium]
MKPFAESCLENRGPILDVLRVELAGRRRLLEIGSGTGQHAVYLAGALPGLVWQTSELPHMLRGIRAWLAEPDTPPNVRPPIVLDVAGGPWPRERYDAVFSANTAHIMHWEQVCAMFEGVGKILEPEGLFCLYGPFNYGGRYTSQSNARFDQWLKARDPGSGIRDFEALDEQAGKACLSLRKDWEMPANNRTLVWQRTG